jgi:hypothetical protein
MNDWLLFISGIFIGMTIMWIKNELMNLMKDDNNE